MGDPRKHKKKYSTPSHPWQKERIVSEKELIGQYGLKNKTEFWKMNSILRKLSNQAKDIIASDTKQSDIEKQQLVRKCHALDLIADGEGVENILGIDIRKILDRRLQTIVTNKGLSRTNRQARQFIVHGHIKVGKKAITSPSYLVRKKEEAEIEFNSLSSLKSQDHPERQQSKKQQSEKKNDHDNKKVEASAGPKERHRKREADNKRKDSRKENPMRKKNAAK